MIRAEIADRGSAARLETAQDELRTGIDQALTALADGDEDAQGPCAALTRGVQQLQETIDEGKARGRELRNEDALLAGRVERIEDVAARAWKALKQGDDR